MDKLEKMLLSYLLTFKATLQNYTYLCVRYETLRGALWTR